MPLNGGSSFLISLLLAVGVVVSSANLTTIDLTSTSSPSPSPPSPSSSSPSSLKSSKGFFLSSALTTSTTTLKPFNTSTATVTEHLTSTEFFNSSTSSLTSSPLSPPSTTTFEPLPQPLPQQQQPQSSSFFKWNSVSSGQQNDLSYKLNCTPDYMTIEVNLTGVSRDRPVYVYLEKLKTFSICRPKMAKGIATFHLALDDNFYRCGTTKVHDQRTGTRVYYNRVIVEGKMGPEKSPRSVYFKCSLPSASRILQTAAAAAAAAAKNRPKRQLLLRESGSPPQPNHNRALGAGQLVNFTEIDLPDNFMEAEILDLDGNITARAPYPHLNLKVKRNGQLVNTSLNVAPGTPLEMIIYLDEESAAVYGLLASFLKVTDSTQAQIRAPITSSSSPPKEEVIVLNGCSIDPYIFGNFETTDGGDSVSAKFRAFKFPESNYVMFVGTVNVCLGECSGVPCGGETVAFGRRRRRRRRRSVPDEMPRDPKKVFEIEMTTYLQIGYSPAEEEAAAAARKRREQGESVSSSQTLMAASFQQAQASKLTTASQQHQESLPTSSSRQLASSGEVPLQSFLLMMTMMMMAIISGGGLLHR